jgi:hypothetical protein
MRGTLPLLLLALATVATPSLAQERNAASREGGSPDDVAARARSLYIAGTEQVRIAAWANALASFQQSQELKPHAITMYNIAACQRAIGRYTMARKTFLEALARSDAQSGELPQNLTSDAKGFVKEIDDLLAHLRVTLVPADASIAVDGAPLEVESTNDATRLVAGIAKAGPGTPPPGGRFEVLLDPGAHVILLSRKGFSDILVNRTLPPGSTNELKLELDRLPAVLHVAANRDGAVVRVGGADVGIAPVDVSRPAGSYRVVVTREGFATYETQVDVKAGEESSLRATLTEKSTPLTKRWWFWTGLGVLVAGAAAATYFATRPEPTRPPLSGGTLGWTVPIQ